MNRKILQRLIWKDARTSRSLVTATLVAIVGFYILLGIFGALANLPGTQRMSIGYAIWFLLPMLVACGAPAVLVGGEEESGSLAWLQTLPASWRSISLSKLIVTSVSLLIVWCVGTLIFLLFWSSMGNHWIGQARQAQTLPEPFWIHLFGGITVSLAVMLISFATAYFFRSPITALIAVVPLFVAVTAGVLNVIPLVVPVEQLRGPPDLVIASTITKLACILAGALIILFVLSHLAAWRRLTRHESRLAQRFRGNTTSDAFRPPREALHSRYTTSTIFGRPNKFIALLWQQIRPIRWHLVILTLSAIAGALLIGTRNPWNAFGFLLCVPSLFMIAALSFYGDSVRKRCLFLSDRGISPTLVWITRVGPTLFISLIVLSVIAVVAMLHHWLQWDGTASRIWYSQGLNWVVIGFAGFAVSQLVSQWSPRPALAFFAAPVMFTVGAFVLGGLLAFYQDSWGVLIVSALILLFASWRLMPTWMAGESGREYVGPFIGYLALAMLLPYFLVLGTRWITAPGDQSQWRREMLTMQLPRPEADTTKVSVLYPAFVTRLGSLGTRATVAPEGREDRIADELAATDTVGDHIAFKELLQISTGIPYSNLRLHQDQTAQNEWAYGSLKALPDTKMNQSARKLQLDAVRVLIKWSRIVREQAVLGNVSLNVVLGVAEHADLLASRVLQAYVDQDGITPELGELISSMPDKDLVRQSRRLSLIRDWKKSELLPDRFAGEYVSVPDQWWLGVERMRSARYIDELCQCILDQWESGQAFQSPDSIAEMKRLEYESYLDRNRADGSNYYQGPPLSERVEMTVQVDRSMDKLRRSQEAGR